MSKLTEPFMFNYQGEDHDLHEIIGEENVYQGDEFSKPIIVKGGINKLCKKFGFKDINYTIQWTDLSHANVQIKTPNGAMRQESLGPICTVILQMEDSDKLTFLGDGEANLVNCKGIAAAHMQAMAIKRARSRAVLQRLGIDAYGEEESQDFEKTVPYEKALKKFLADSIINLSESFAEPLEKEALRDEIKSHCDLGPDAKFTFDFLDTIKLMTFYGKLYARYLEDNTTKED